MCQVFSYDSSEGARAGLVEGGKRSAPAVVAAGFLRTEPKCLFNKLVLGLGCGCCRWLLGDSIMSSVVYTPTTPKTMASSRLLVLGAAALAPMVSSTTRGSLS